MGTMTIRLDRTSGIGMRRNPNVYDLPTIYQRKASATAGAKVTLEDSSRSSTEDELDLQFSFQVEGILPQGYWKLEQPLLLVLELDDDGTFVISDEVFARYGAGSTPQSAYEDYINDLTNYYDIIAESAMEANPAATSMLAHIREYLLPIIR